MGQTERMGYESPHAWFYYLFYKFRCRYNVTLQDTLRLTGYVCRGGARWFTVVSRVCCKVKWFTSLVLNSFLQRIDFILTLGRCWSRASVTLFKLKSKGASINKGCSIYCWDCLQGSAKIHRISH